MPCFDSCMMSSHVLQSPFTYFDEIAFRSVLWLKRPHSETTWNNQGMLFNAGVLLPYCIGTAELLELQCIHALPHTALFTSILHRSIVSLCCFRAGPEAMTLPEKTFDLLLRRLLKLGAPKVLILIGVHALRARMQDEMGHMRECMPWVAPHYSDRQNTQVSLVFLYRMGFHDDEFSFKPCTDADPHRGALQLPQVSLFQDISLFDLHGRFIHWLLHHIACYAFCFARLL